ncbi:hypothetical protein [Actinoplanes teichomyceticus]|uniref:Anti-sigma factor n=1 Tax=Actinoplanes teichomyceticus TaxID=1867 RepID=A0A561WRE6_ACTTI|nr:hypothetical protein [Actinoplanes teichomyceticus]TWG26435.1 hypothetical protein FHX34_1011419 [Actinoplanes teichomyceticus]GIF11511.1 hypothetical protein Ate01nite_15430 [Actinoplanes teichomyceticus]
MTGAEFHGVDIDLLADYAGGALDGTPEAERVAALIAADPAWQEAYSVLAPQMAAVGALLGELPAETMPEDVAARLDAAFAAAGAPDPARPATDAVPGTVQDLAGRRRTRGNHRWLRFTAPIGIAAGAVALLGYTLARPQTASEDSGSAPEAVPAMGGVMVAATPATTLNTGTDYSLGTLGQSRKGGPEAPLSAPDDISSAREPESALARLRLPDALLDCLTAIARQNGGGAISAESVDYARFDGQPALVVQFTAANGQWIWASGTDCGLPGGGADTLGSVPVR